MDNKFLVRDEGPVSYFAMIPHLVDDSNLSAFGYRLYGHLKRVAGDSGECWQSQENLEKACHMSNRTVVKAKRELLKSGLIELQVKIVNNHPQHVIAIVNIWQQNENVYRCTSAPEVQPIGVDQHLASVYNDTSKNNPLRITTVTSEKKRVPETFEEYADKLKERFPGLDFALELEKFNMYWSEGKRQLNRPKTALLNWMTKAEQFRKERGNGANREHLEEDPAERLRASVGRPL